MKFGIERGAVVVCASLVATILFCIAATADTSPAPLPSSPTNGTLGGTAVPPSRGMATATTNSSTNGTSSLTTKPKVKLKAFHGKITAWDTNSMSLTVIAWRKHVFLVTPATKITKNNESVNLEAIAVGESLVGQYEKKDDGKLVATSLHLKAKGEPNPKWPEENETGR